MWVSTVFSPTPSAVPMPAVGPALGHQPDDVALPGGERFERVDGAALRGEDGDQFRVDHRSAGRDGGDRAGQRLLVGDALLEQIPGAAAVSDHAQGRGHRDVHGEREHGDPRPRSVSSARRP
jgi:hypothetical protein